METVNKLKSQIQEVLHINQANALVTGATGIIGNAVVERLSNSSNWGKIHACSRSQPAHLEHPKVQHSKIDLSSSPSEIAKHLRENNVQEISYVFYSAYLADDDEDKATEINSNMLRNLLEGLQEADPGSLKRVVLTSGYKFYGVHLGEVIVPMEENDPRVEGKPYPSNFYYGQEDVLAELSKKNGGNWDYTVVMPNDVCGYARKNFMNLATTVALYAVISRELSEPFYFPGNATFYHMIDDISHASLIAEFEEWVAFTPAATGLFNIHNGDVHTWSKTWPKVAKYFGTTVPKDNFTAETPFGNESSLPFPPPINQRLEETSHAKKLDNSRVINRVSLVKWAEREEVKAAWKRIAQRENLKEETFSAATWAFADFVWGRTYNIYASMDKAKQLGWTGYVDTFEGYISTFERLQSERMIPKK